MPATQGLFDILIGFAPLRIRDLRYDSGAAPAAAHKSSAEPADTAGPRDSVRAACRAVSAEVIAGAVRLRSAVCPRP